MLEAEFDVAVDCFADSLADLTVNSKPLINFLTMVAKENVQYADVIVRIVDSHLKKAPSIVKLPIMYLIDSIIKNVATKYTELFLSVIKESFASIYKEADITVRESMFKLRQTWDGIFPSKDLCAIDIEIHSFDSSWLLEGESLDTFKTKPCKILLNPRFLPLEPKETVVEETEVDEAEMLREQLLLQKQKRDLEKKKQANQHVPEPKSNASQADSTTIENSTSDHDCPETQAPLAGNSQKDSHKLMDLLSDLVSRQNCEPVKDNEDSDYAQKLSSLKHRDISPRSHSSYDGHKMYRRSSRHSNHRSYRDKDFKSRKESYRYRNPQLDTIVCARKKYKRETSPSSDSSTLSIEKFHSRNSSTHKLFQCTQTSINLTSSEFHVKTAPPCNLKSVVRATEIEECKEGRGDGNFAHIHNVLKRKFIPNDIFYNNDINDLPSYLVLKNKKTLLPNPITESGPSFSLKCSRTCHDDFPKDRVLLPEKLVEITEERIFDYKHGYGTPERKLEKRSSPTNNLPIHFTENQNCRLPEPISLNDFNSNVKYPMVSLPPACTLTLRRIAQDPMGTISLDGVSQDVRYYGHTAIIGAGTDNPREILFKPGEASIVLNNLVVHCAFHEPSKEIMLMGKCYRLHLGAPTREVFVNNEGFQCAFNYPPKNIQLSTGEVFTVRLQCSAMPLVHIGALRRDLVSGSVSLFINGVDISRVFLDAKPQRFDIAGVPHVLKFENNFRTTLINDQVVNLHFGGPAVGLSVNGEIFYLQLSNLPPGLILGQFSVRGMGFMLKGQNPILEPGSSDHTANYPYASKLFYPLSQTEKGDWGNGKKKRYKRNLQIRRSGQPLEPNEIIEEYKFTSTPQCERSRSFLTIPLSANAPTSSPNQSSQNNTGNVSAFEPCVNIHALFQNLCDVGLLTPPKMQTKDGEDAKNKCDTLEVNFSEPSALKTKQPGLINVLYSGVQCSSCGERFSPDEDGTYRKHLDWHFQTNHETRKPQSRLWFLNVKNWIKFEAEAVQEVEADHKANGDQSSTQEEFVSSVPSHDFPHGSVCDVCQDKFEEYFNEEQDEWHLKDCICHDGLVYHPVCFKDFQMTSDAAVHKRLQLLEDDVRKESLPFSSNEEQVNLPAIVKRSATILDVECEKDVLSNSSIQNNYPLNEKCCLVEEVDNSNGSLPAIEFLSKDNRVDTELVSLLPQPKLCSSLTAVLNHGNKQNISLDNWDSWDVEIFSANENNLTKETVNTMYPIPALDLNSAVVTEDNTFNTTSPHQETCGMLKTKLNGRKLTTLPPVIKGSDTSNMCTVT